MTIVGSAVAAVAGAHSEKLSPPDDDVAPIVVGSVEPVDVGSVPPVGSVITPEVDDSSELASPFGSPGQPASPRAPANISTTFA